jgi:hypothetical protein
MSDAKFDCLINPFGTIFNPLSIEILLNSALIQNQFEENLICERDGLFFHYWSHSDLVADSKDKLIAQLTLQQIQTKVYLEQGTHLILTLGTAWVYELPKFGVVANCHKQPSRHFSKRLLSLEEMESKLSALFENFSQILPHLKIILTLSPVRHIKDGVSENQLSKSLLRVLCTKLEKKYAAVSYFPAYEIMIDELRDYRFYKPDLIHPSEEAEGYIWKKWSDSHFSLETKAKIEEIRKVYLELAHKSFNPESNSHQNFLKNLLQKLERLDHEFDFSNEIKEVKSSLNS